ncbi:DNA-binding response regulator [Marinilabiliaceae bacterium JC017]|nr:DNA-binding response regulator [Marinilabiliaceae bacterium JC017]
MKALIIEDEYPTQRMLTGLINQLRPEWEIVACIDSVSDAIEWLQTNDHPDIIFSDIQLADGVCFEIYDQVKPDSFIIFTTAYDEYAIQAFQVNSVDYLLKPIAPDKLEMAIEKLEVYKQSASPAPAQNNITELAQALLSGQTKYRNRLLVNTADGFIKLNIEEVAFFYSSHKVSSAITFDQETHTIDFSLDKLEKQLDPTVFFRANRQFILHIDAITKVETWFNGKLVVKTKPEAQEKIIVSRERARTFKEWINQ